jgi:hypothetical protein
LGSTSWTRNTHTDMPIRSETEYNRTATGSRAATTHRPQSDDETQGSTARSEQLPVKLTINETNSYLQAVANQVAAIAKKKKDDNVDVAQIRLDIDKDVEYLIKKFCEEKGMTEGATIPTLSAIAKAYVAERIVW